MLEGADADGAIDLKYYDTAGVRAMGYYDWIDLPFYYFMASNCVTSDNWFSPVLDRTQLNRMYLFAATSQGYVYPPGTDAQDNAPLTAPMIFDSLQKAGVSWKVYETDPHSTYLTQFAEHASPNPLPPNLVPASEFLTDANAGTLPSVSLIECGYSSGRDEHPENDVQTGAAYAASLIAGFMNSASWNDSVFILTYDEAADSMTTFLHNLRSIQMESLRLIFCLAMFVLAISAGRPVISMSRGSAFRSS